MRHPELNGFLGIKLCHRTAHTPLKPDFLQQNRPRAEVQLEDHSSAVAISARHKEYLDRHYLSRCPEFRDKPRRACRDNRVKCPMTVGALCSTIRARSKNRDWRLHMYLKILQMRLAPALLIVLHLGA